MNVDVTNRWHLGCSKYFKQNNYLILKTTKWGSAIIIPRLTDEDSEAQIVKEIVQGRKE